MQNGELAWQRMAARTKEKLRRSAVLKQRAATAKLLRAYEDEDYRKQVSKQSFASGNLAHDTSLSYP